MFEAPGVLTPRGHYVLEPSYQFGYSSSNRVALVGYTIIPALLIGLVDVRELKRNTNTVTLAGRYGLTNRTEVELRLPYTYRSDSTVSRELFHRHGSRARIPDQRPRHRRRGNGHPPPVERWRAGQLLLCGRPARQNPYRQGSLRGGDRLPDALRRR
ncbi:hypothetical protein ACHMW6_14045 [Pseudoduganella sp. UC29_106]|uniref:hypothetical protein n=1 Tax=Pseudoduganella sp. UC29_106 TaxID=3374553 RepID=UPI0037571A19